MEKNPTSRHGNNHRRARAVVACVTMLITVLLVGAGPLSAQAPSAIQAKYRRIVKLIHDGHAAELARLVRYPLRRPNPLHDIRSRAEFIRYVDVLFDADFKARLDTFKAGDIFQHQGNFGLYAGEIWIDEDGKIIAINHRTPAEEKLLEEETRRVKAALHPSVREWTRNVLVYRCPKHTLRIDETDAGLRLATWNAGRSMSDAPDLLLTGGTMEMYGTQGGVGYTFTNGEWTYLVERLDLCAEGSRCGPMLTVSRNGAVVREYSCDERK